MRIIFHHIPKTAGTAIRTLVEQNYQPDQVVAMYDIEKGPKGLEWAPGILARAGNADPSVFMGHQAVRLLPALEAPFQYFTVLREPVDRVVSLFYFAANHPGPQLPRVAKLIQDERLTLEDVWNVPRNEITDGGRFGHLRQFFNGQTRNLLRNTQSLETFPIDASTEVQDERYEEVSTMLRQHFWVGAQERLDEFMAFVADQLGWQHRELERVNVTSKRPERSEIDGALRARIEDGNRLDVRLYREFGGPPRE